MPGMTNINVFSRVKYPVMVSIQESVTAQRLNLTMETFFAGLQTVLVEGHPVSSPSSPLALQTLQQSVEQAM